MKLKCLQCGHEFDGTIEYDELGWHSTCPKCDGSFDVDAPIHYPLAPSRGPIWMSISPISDDDLRRAEDDYYDRVESYWGD